MVTSHMRGAVANHKGAAGVAWKKWDGREFTRENLQDESASFKDTSGKRLPNGENPSIHWNRFLQQWLLVWNGYNGNIYITAAKTLPNFEPPKILVEKKTSVEKNWYPSVISEDTGDRVGGQELHLYYKHFPEGLSRKSFFKTFSFKLSR